MASSLSKAFNADGERKKQLDLLEKALSVLNYQKDKSHEDRSMHGDIADSRRFLWQWRGIDDDGKFTRPKGSNPHAEEINNTYAFMVGLQGAVLGEITQAEPLLLKVMTQVFGGDAEKLKAFYADAPKLVNEKSQAWMQHTADWYDHPAGVDFPPALAVTAAAVKFSGPKLIDKQITAINAMIDEGKFSNIAKRIVWQVGQAFKA